ncbi:MAG TPA: hypothetical protein PLT28_00425 [Saprospiraceae bacterium]|nr:hypothetical protein [Saprospiraceae bacterium]
MENLGLSDFDLISGRDIVLPQICTVHQPTLDDIRHVGIMIYRAYLNTLLLNINSLLQVKNIQSNELQILQNTPIFVLLIQEETMRKMLVESLSFFVKEKLEFDKEVQGIWALDEDVPIGLINAKSFPFVRSAIIRLSYLEDTESAKSVLKFRNSKASRIFNQIQEGRAQTQKNNKATQNLDIANLISAVSAKHPSYNLLNIWGLTVYQLYDQFYRISRNVAFDINSTRWSVWGEDEFDLSVWYQKLKEGE